MKKIFLTLVCVIVCATSMTANDYRHSIGGVVGNLYGVSYKGLFPIGGIDGFGFEADMGVKLLSTPSWVHMAQGGATANFFTFELTPSLLYQNLVTEFDEGRLDWYAGGGVSIGMGQGFNGGALMGKFGFHGMGGIEFVFDAPVNVGLDFRPGYGLLFDDYAELSFFDWTVAASVRYRF